jgi:hypothetical protein
MKKGKKVIPTDDEVVGDEVIEETEELEEQLSDQEEQIEEVQVETVRQTRLQEQIAKSDKLLIAQCGYLLTSVLAASKLPELTQARLRKQFEGTVFQPAQLSSTIDEARKEISALTGALSIHGPARISGMFNTEDQVQLATEDLFGLPREKGKESVKVAKLQGIRELYLMLTGDFDFRGGYDPVRAMLATTTDFSGLVKNALNKIIVGSFENMGRAGYDWWKAIVLVEHFNNLNSITGTLVGTIASLPSVAEQAEYTELAVGDSPETASFTKYGGYIPLTLEAIDRDETRKLRQYAIELGNAAMRNISEQIAYIFSQAAGLGPTMADGQVLFNNTAVTSAGGHANLLTTALGADYVAWLCPTWTGITDGRATVYTDIDFGASAPVTSRLIFLNGINTDAAQAVAIHTDDTADDMFILYSGVRLGLLMPVNSSQKMQYKYFFAPTSGYYNNSPGYFYDR